MESQKGKQFNHFWISVENSPEYDAGVAFLKMCDCIEFENMQGDSVELRLMQMTKTE